MKGDFKPAMACFEKCFKLAYEKGDYQLGNIGKYMFNDCRGRCLENIVE